MPEAHTFAQLLHPARRGDREALDPLIALVCDELRRLAQRAVQRERKNQTSGARPPSGGAVRSCSAPTCATGTGCLPSPWRLSLEAIAPVAAALSGGVVEVWGCRRVR